MKIELDKIKDILFYIEKHGSENEFFINGKGCYSKNVLKNLRKNKFKENVNDFYFYIHYLMDGEIIELAFCDPKGYDSLKGEIKKQADGYKFDLKKSYPLVKGISTGDKWDNFEDPVRITYKGYEFLNTIRHDNYFSKLKEEIKETGGNMPIEIIKNIGMKYISSKLEEKLGIK